jgi:hypothetical protein
MYVHFDPNHGCLISRIDYLVPQGGAVSTVDKFLEISPGLFFPGVISSATKNGDSSWVVTFTKVQLNQPLPPDAFTFRFSSGLLVSDQIRNDMFRTNERGEAVLPAKTTSGQKITLSDSMPVPADPEKQAKSESATLGERPSYFGTWVTTVSVLFIVTGIGIMYRRRRRTRE